MPQFKFSASRIRQDVLQKADVVDESSNGASKRLCFISHSDISMSYRRPMKQFFIPICFIRLKQISLTFYNSMRCSLLLIDISASPTDIKRAMFATDVNNHYKENSIFPFPHPLRKIEEILKPEALIANLGNTQSVSVRCSALVLIFCLI